jgi:predicted enzyme related to lactoylglutathione lyase
MVSSIAKGTTMPTRDTAPLGAPCWVDLGTSDTERSRDFYCQLFGWTAEEPNEQFGGYFNFAKDGIRIAGCMASRPGVGVPDVWSVYLATDDAAKTVDTAVAGGGQVNVVGPRLSGRPNRLEVTGGKEFGGEQLAGQKARTSAQGGLDQARGRLLGGWHARPRAGRR